MNRPNDLKCCLTISIDYFLAGSDKQIFGQWRHQPIEGWLQIPPNSSIMNLPKEFDPSLDLDFSAAGEMNIFGRQGHQPIEEYGSTNLKE